MTYGYDENGEKIIFNYENNRWEYLDGEHYYIGAEKTRICLRCNKPKISMNGVKGADFCLQSLTTCEFIDNACCGHGDDSQAYISFKDGRRWILDKEWGIK